MALIPRTTGGFPNPMRGSFLPSLERNSDLSKPARLVPSLACATALGVLLALGVGLLAGPADATLDFVRASSDTRLRNEFASAGYSVEAGTLGERVAIVATCVRRTCGDLPVVPGVVVVERAP